MCVNTAISIATQSYLAFMFICGVYMGAMHPNTRSLFPFLDKMFNAIGLTITIAISLVCMGFFIGSIIVRELVRRIAEFISEVMRGGMREVEEMFDVIAEEHGGVPNGHTRCYVDKHSGSFIHVSKRSHCGFEFESGLRSGKKRYVCIICTTRQPDVLHIPCNHISCCSDCANTYLRTNPARIAFTCPICRDLSTELKFLHISGLYVNS